MSRISKTKPNIAASRDSGAKSGKSGKGGAEREEQNGRNRIYMEKKQIGSEVQKFKNEQKFRREQTNTWF